MTRPSQTVSLGINVEFLDEDEEGHAGHGLPEITALRPGGLAEAASVLHVGDVLMAVNGINVSEDPDELISALSSAVGTITFTILRPLPPPSKRWPASRPCRRRRRTKSRRLSRVCWPPPPPPSASSPRSPPPPP